MKLRTYTVPLTTKGSNGSASATADIKIPVGFLAGIQVDYTNEPATTDVTVTCKVGGTISTTVFTKSNSNTDIPLTRVVGSAIDPTGGNVAAAGGSYGPLLGGTVTVAVAQGDNNGTVQVVLVVTTPGM